MIRHVLIAGLLFATPLLAGAETTIARVHSVSGDAEVTLPGGKTEKIVADLALPPGSVIHVSTGTVDIHLMPGADTVVSPGTDVTISKLDYSKDASGQASRQVLLDLHKGTVFNDLVHGDGVSTFDVQTPRGVAAARGTVWSVSVIGDTVYIKVLRGTIFFGPIHIPEGHGYSTGTGLIVVLTPQELSELINVFVSVGLNVNLTVGGRTTVFPGNPSNTASPEQ